MKRDGKVQIEKWKKKLPGISSKLGVGAKCFNPEVEMAELADVLARDLATTILLEIWNIIDIIIFLLFSSNYF